MEIFVRSVPDLLLVSVFLGGGAAWLTGRATARIWAPWWQLILYLVLLTVAVRFIHYSLFEGYFFLPPADFFRGLAGAAMDFVILVVLGSLGRIYTRSRQMRRQYGFLYR